MSSQCAATDRARRVWSGARLVFVGNAASKALLLGSEFALAGALGPKPFGAYAIAFVLLVVATSFCQLGTNFGIVHYMPIMDDRKDSSSTSLIRASFLSMFSIGTLVAALVYGSAPSIAFELFDEVRFAAIIQLLACALPFEVLNQSASAVFRGRGQIVHHLCASGLWRNSCTFLASMATIVWQLPLEAVFVGLLLGSLLGSAHGLVMVRHDLLRKASLQNEGLVLRQLLRFSVPLAAWNVLNMLAGRSIVLLGGIFLTTADTGILALLQRTLQGLYFIRSTIVATAPVEMARLYHAKDFTGMERLLNDISVGLLKCCLWISIPILVQPFLILSLISPECSSYSWALWLLFAAGLINVGGGPVGHVLINSNNQRSLFYCSILEAALQLAIVVPAMMLWGLEGAIIAETIRMCLYIMVRHRVVWHALHIQTLTHRFGYIYLAGFAAIALGCTVAFGLEGWAGYLSGVGLAAVLLGGLLRRQPTDPNAKSVDRKHANAIQTAIGA